VITQERREDYDFFYVKELPKNNYMIFFYVKELHKNTYFVIFSVSLYPMELITRGNISKAAFRNQHKQLSVDDRNEWQDVRIVVIDEVSFMSDTILKTLDRKLKEIKNRSQPFGGFTIIFAGDFRQLEPIGVNDTELLFSSLSSQHWENCINAVIILDNEHRFKEDPEYGQMLKRMWSGDLTKEDRMRINTRVLGSSGLELPPDFEGK
jgi:hypothetical protein